MLTVAALFVLANEPLSEKLLRDCRVSVGPVAFSTLTQAASSQPGPLARDAPESTGNRFAVACGRNEQTRLVVFARLPSGQQGTLCELAGIVGVPHSLVATRVGGAPLLWLETIDRTPEEERVVDEVVAPHWGRCEVVAAADVRHPTDGPTLLEPHAGVQFDATGFDIWQGVSRYYFGTPRRHVATAMRGLHVSGEGAAFSSQEIAAPFVLAISTIFPGTLSAHQVSEVGWPNEALVRGVKLTVREQRPAKTLLSVDTEVASATWRTDETQWSVGPGIFGAGLLPRAGGDQARQVVAFFEPALSLRHLQLRGGDADLDILAAQVFVDAANVEPFEASEDYGESAEPVNIDARASP